MNQQIKIEFDAKSNKLLLRCPFYANDLIHDMPARRWQKKLRAWMVPLTRKNVEFICQKIMQPGYAEITEAATLAIGRLQLEAYKEHGNTGFPAWYKFKTQPRRHQRAALEKLYGLRTSASFMIMRAGKTKTEIDTSCALRMEGKIDSLLIVCKLSVRRTWVNEFEMHAPIPVSIHLPDTGKAGWRAFDVWARRKHEFPVLVIGLESLSQGGMIEIAKAFMLGRSHARMAIDESSLIASHDAIRTEACMELGRMADYRSILTGTPHEESPLLLYSQFEFLDTNIIGIGDWYAFKNRYAVMGGYHVEMKNGTKRPVQVVGYQNLEELTKLIAPYTFEVGENDLDLPPKQHTRRYVQLTKKQRDLYDQIRKNKEYEWKGKPVVIENVLELILRLHQVVGGYTVTKSDPDARGKRKSEPHIVVGPDNNPKVVELLSIVAEAGKQQGIAWCAYRPEIAACVAALKKAGKQVAEIHGGIPEDQREYYRQLFQKGKIDWLVGNTTTGGMGLDLSAANIVVYFSNTNKLIDRTQSEERPRAIGKKHNILIIDIMAEKTVDDVYMKAIETKQDLRDYVRTRLREALAMLAGTS